MRAGVVGGDPAILHFTPDYFPTSLRYFLRFCSFNSDYKSCTLSSLDGVILCSDGECGGDLPFTVFPRPSICPNREQKIGN